MNKTTREWYYSEENKTRLPALIGKKVIDAKHYYVGPFCEGWLLTFSDGSVLTANDGEYGCDTFQFVDAKEQEELLRKTENP